MSRITCPHDGRKTEFAAHDGRVRRSSTVVGDNRSGTPHDGQPVWIGRPSYKDGAVDEALHLTRTLDDADRTGRYCFADAHTGDELAACVVDAIGLHRTGFASRLDSFRSSLNDEHFIGLAVLRPLDVHRLAIMLL